VNTARPLLFVVDDEEAIRGALRVLLRGEGFDVRTFASGPEALAALAEATPACMLADYHMPGMDGRELIEALRLRDASVPVILMTGRDDPAQLPLRGHAHVVQKPFDAGLLISKLRELVGREMP